MILMNVQGIMQSEKYQSQKATHYRTLLFIFIYLLWKDNILEMENQLLDASG